MQSPKEVAQVLRALAETLERNGFPQEPFIVQGNPQAPFGFFLALWKPKSQDRDTAVLCVGLKEG